MYIEQLGMLFWLSRLLAVNHWCRYQQRKWKVIECRSTILLQIKIYHILSMYMYVLHHSITKWKLIFLKHKYILLHSLVSCVPLYSACNSTLECVVWNIYSFELWVESYGLESFRRICRVGVGTKSLNMKLRKFKSEPFPHWNWKIIFEVKL